LKEKKYIDVGGKLEAEWLGEFDAVIQGKFEDRPSQAHNIEVSIRQATPRTIDVSFTACYFPSEIDFAVHTSQAPASIEPFAIDREPVFYNLSMPVGPEGARINAAGMIAAGQGVRMRLFFDHDVSTDVILAAGIPGK
jgi:hypothetical protein